MKKLLFSRASLFCAIVIAGWLVGRFYEERPTGLPLSAAQLRAVVGGKPVTQPPTCYDDGFYSCSPCGVQIKCNAYNGGNCYDEAGSWFCPVTDASKVNVYADNTLAATGWYDLNYYQNKPLPCELAMDCECVPDPNNPMNPPTCSVVSFNNICGTVTGLATPAGDVCP